MSSNTKLILGGMFVFIVLISVLSFNGAQLTRVGDSDKVSGGDEVPNIQENQNVNILGGQGNLAINIEEAIAVISERRREGARGRNLSPGLFGGIDSFGLVYVESDDVSIVTSSDVWVGRNLEVLSDLWLGRDLLLGGSIKTSTGDVIVRLGR